MRPHGRFPPLRNKRLHDGIDIPAGQELPILPSVGEVIFGVIRGFGNRDHRPRQRVRHQVQPQQRTGKKGSLGPPASLSPRWERPDGQPATTFISAFWSGESPSTRRNTCRSSGNKFPRFFSSKFKTPDLSGVFFLFQSQGMKNGSLSSTTV